MKIWEVEVNGNKVLLYPRLCEDTGKGMVEGYCIGDGQSYTTSEEAMKKDVVKAGYKDMEEAYNDEYYYWTEWYDLDLEEEGIAYDGEGNLYEFINGEWEKQ